MSFAKYKKNNNIEWGINTDGFEFKKCAEMPLDTEINLRGFFITPDKGYGRGAVLIMDNSLLNIPNRYVEDIITYMNDEELVQAVKDGKCAFKITTFMSKYNRMGYAIEFLDK